MPDTARQVHTPRADEVDEFGDDALGRGYLGGFTGQCHLVAADVDVGGQELLEGTQVDVTRAEQPEHDSGRDFDSGCDPRPARLRTAGLPALVGVVVTHV